MANQKLSLPAPAKINLFLHIIGRRADGYHNLQTAFQFLDYGDTLHFSVNNTGAITLTGNLPDVACEDNLIVKAARLLQQTYPTPFGVDIQLDKIIPMGSGLGGGSSDAATTLVALNDLWQLHCPPAELMALGAQIGVDVAIFIYGQAAFAQGIGTDFTAISPEKLHYAVIKPDVHASTVAMYTHPDLTRDTPVITLSDFTAATPTHNDFQPLALQLYPEIQQAFDWLGQFGKPRLTGSGAALFLACENARQAHQIVGQMPAGMVGFAAQGQNRSPLYWDVAKR